MYLKSLLYSYISEGMKFSTAVYLWGLLCGYVSCLRKLSFWGIIKDDELGCHEIAVWK